jgi:hypothetical protein
MNEGRTVFPASGMGEMAGAVHLLSVLIPLIPSVILPSADALVVDLTVICRYRSDIGQKPL